ncbi:2-dehydro-3-deoxy-D-gluconate 5-dehydrogenase KduD [Rhizobium herbae]|uniref:2-deoxy-D-gluconate 3-dehydrogenase n=1 Tax=Rhizobium herbae TaxID=508661 RepID=A0ABS4EPR8_9HYPH|nr:2-dehydro-3-deoxy-D-gluconate 5-dehydrogenase KduD [Rhizobium herbae]MBP1859940.1 2-deoxy-D-gluconate 3-dehydrogenase [Rhizobium herbae]
MFDLTGQVALVTGARTGLGQAAAITLARAGADIAAIGSQPMPETAERIAALGRRFFAIQQDLGSPFGGAELIGAVTDTLGGIDILVNNAGIIRRNDLADYSLEDWDAVNAVNLRAAFQLSQAAAVEMVRTRRGGRIINIASMLSYQGGIRVVAYTAAKHGIVGLTKAMANELATHGITVNAIAPGYMATDNTSVLRQDTNRSRDILARIPMGRWGKPDDLATAILFLASPASGYITATTIPVDGGWLSR